MVCRLVRIYAVHLDQMLDQETFHQLSTYLSVERENRIRALQNNLAAHRTLIGGLLARYVLSKKLQVASSDLCFYQNEYGKPLLKSSRPLHFNLSYSGEWVVCSISSTSVGVAIEKMNPIDYAKAKRFFTPDEYEELLNKEEIERLAYYYRLWCLKESYLKATGKGLYHSMDAFCITPSIRSGQYEVENGKQTFYVKEYALDPAYKLAVCAKNKGFAEQIKQMQASILVRNFMAASESHTTPFSPKLI